MALASRKHALEVVEDVKSVLPGEGSSLVHGMAAAKPDATSPPPPMRRRQSLGEELGALELRQFSGNSAIPEDEP